MNLKKLENYNIILASQSPRRQYLLKELGLEFQVKTKGPVDEEYPSELKEEEIPVYIAQNKALVFDGELEEMDILITADTIVWLDGEIVRKPASREDAIKILSKLSGKCHQVYTGVCLTSRQTQTTFWSSTDVYFKPLSLDEIKYYIQRYEPYDKAGAYGIQEWIGYIGVEKINGSFYNVMGLPIQKVYTELNNFIDKQK